MTPDALLRELPDADTEQQRLDEDCEAKRSVIGGTARATAGLRKTTTRNSPWPSGRVPDGALPAFVDSSALVAMLDADDARHAQASRIRDHLVDGARGGSRTLVTHHALVVETSAVLARRFGMRAQPDLFQNLLWRVRIVWINADQQGSPRSG